MPVDSATGSPVEERGVAASLFRSVVTQYWSFTVYVLMYAVFGIALGSLVGSFRPTVAFLLGAALWFGLEGLHAVDLAEPSVAVDLDASVQRYVGYIQVAAGCTLGALVAMMTTWWFLALVVVGAVSGLAYNEEWFDGLFHDRDKLTGLANFGLSWGTVPFLAGYIAMGETLTAGAVLLAVGIALDAAELNYLVGPSKMERYRDMNIKTTREYEPDVGMMEKRMHNSQKIQMVSWVCIAAGAALLTVV
jgi:hypothetical protein